MILHITSPVETISVPDVESVDLPTTHGQIEILPGHAETFAALVSGEVRAVVSNEKYQVFNIVSGQCYVSNDVVSIIL